MDQLVIPRVMGPLSELSPSVRVQGQCEGATVRLKSLTRPSSSNVVAEGVAESGDQRFPLLPGVQLSDQDRLVAIQELAGFDSSPLPTGDQAMRVQPKPRDANQIGYVGFAGHPYECGLAVAVSGAIPGAPVELRVASSGQLLGQRVAFEGSADIGVNPPHRLTVSEPLAVRQVVPGLAPGPDTKRTPVPLPLKSLRTLPAPSLHPPIHVCDTSVLVTNVIDGAKVRIVHGLPGIQPDLSWWSIGGDGWVELDQPLRPGDTLRVQQVVDPGCDYSSTYSPDLPVDPLEPLPPPLVSPPCAGSQNVLVLNCRPGARVRLAANGKTWVGDVPPDQTSHYFTIEPLDLEKGKTVSATQEKCGTRSLPSAEVKVNVHEDVRDPPTVVTPLYECARCISAKNVHPGATLQVWAKNRKANWESPISDIVLLANKQGTISVAPYLRADDEVYVVQWACSDTGLPSQTETVQVHPQVLAPEVEPLFSGTTSVKVKGVIPGALVEVEVWEKDTKEWRFAGGALADTLTSPTVVNCRFTMGTGDSVHARQSLCGLITEFGPSEQVNVPPPLVPDNLSPASGAKNVSEQPVLSWHDPGWQDDRRATSFEGQILQGNQVIHQFSQQPGAGGVTSYPLAAPALIANTAYSWRVCGVNPTASSDFASATFTTAPPPQPVTQTTLVPLKWQVGNAYVKSDPIYALATSKILAVRNPNDTLGHGCNLIFDNGYKLEVGNPGEGVAPSVLKVSDHMQYQVIGATPEPTDGQSTWTSNGWTPLWDIWLELTYTE